MSKMLNKVFYTEQIQCSGSYLWGKKGEKYQEKTEMPEYVSILSNVLYANKKASLWTVYKLETAQGRQPYSLKIFI